jgi:hypothetical protein
MQYRETQNRNGNKIFSEYSTNIGIIMLKAHGHEIIQDISCHNEAFIVLGPNS